MGNRKPIKCLTQDRRRRQLGGSTNPKVDRSIPEPRVALDASIECVCKCYTTCLTKCFYFWVNESKKHFEFSVRAQKHDTSSTPLKQA